MARKSGKLAYNGNDKRFKGISEVIDKIAIQYNTLIDHFRKPSESQSWSPSSVTYHTDEYPSPFTMYLEETNDYDGGIDGLCDVYDTLHTGKNIQDRVFLTAPELTYNSTTNSYNLEGCEFISYVGKYGNRRHYPPYTKTPGIKLKIMGLEPNKPYTLHIDSIYFNIDQESPYYDQMLSLFDDTHTFGIILNGSSENGVGNCGNFEHLSPYNSSSMEYSSLLNFEEELTPRTQYPFFKGYYNNKTRPYQTARLYGSYKFAGTYYPLPQTSNVVREINVTSYSNEEGHMYMFLSLEAVQQVCYISMFGMKVEGTGDIRKVRDAFLESSSDYWDNEYVVQNPGAEIFNGLAIPNPYLGKNGDMYVQCTETEETNIQISENTSTDACHIWELVNVSKLNNKCYINAVSNADPSPEDIVYTVSGIDYIDEPYISVVLSNLDTSTTYHCELHCTNKAADDGSNEYDVFFIDEFIIPHTSTVVYSSFTEKVVKDFYFRPTATSVVLRIPTTAIHLLMPEIWYSNPLIGSWYLVVKSVVPRTLWFKSDYNWYSLGSGGGGSQVIITPTITEGTKIADYRIDGVNGSLFSPYINIVPNPTLPSPPSQRLDTITIGTQSYNVGTEVSFESFLSEGVIIGRLEINGVSYNLFAPEGGGSSKDSTAISEYSDMQSLNPVALNAPSSVTQFSSIQGLNYNLIPSMTSNTAPSGTASASTELDGNHAAWKAFDDKAGSYWLPTAADTAPYLEYDWTSEVTFTQMHIGVFNDGGTTVSRTIAVEGLTSNDVWENCLSLGSFVSLEFRGRSYRRDYFVDLNGGNYKAIRITGNEAWYVNRSYACLIEDLSIF